MQPPGGCFVVSKANFLGTSIAEAINCINSTFSHNVAKNLHLAIFVDKYFLTRTPGLTALTIFCKTILKFHFLLMSENEFFNDIKRDGITSLHGIHDWTITTIQIKLNRLNE